LRSLDAVAQCSLSGHIGVATRSLPRAQVDPTLVGARGYMPIHLAAQRRKADVVKLLAARDDALESHYRLSTDDKVSKRARASVACKLAVLLKFHTRLKRAHREAGGESLLLRCRKATLMARLDQSNVPWPTIDVCRRRDADFLLSSKLAISYQEMAVLETSMALVPGS
jgi:hypothetical protein